MEMDSGSSVGEVADGGEVEGVEPSEGAEPGQVAEIDGQEPEAKPEPAIYKAKVDGEEVEVTEEQLLKDYELRQASYKRFEEANKIQKAAQAREAKLKTVLQSLQNGTPEDFAAFLERLGRDPVEFAEAIAREFVRKSKMTPDQAELEALRRQQQAWNKRQQEQVRQQEEQRIQAQIPAYQNQFVSDYTSAMDAAGVPDDHGLRQTLVQRMASKALQGFQRGGYLLDPKELVSAEWGAIRAAAEKLGGKQAEQARLARVAAGPSSRRPPGAPAAAPAAKGKPAPVRYASGDMDAWSALLGRK